MIIACEKHTHYVTEKIRTKCSEACVARNVTLLSLLSCYVTMYMKGCIFL